MAETEIDSCLAKAEASWLPALEQGQQAFAAGDYAAAITPLSEAITKSAAFHPLFHFVESGLNTELGMLHLQQEAWQEAVTHFDRAIFLHHDNETAIAGLKAAQQHMNDSVIPAYPFAELTRPMPNGELFDLRKQARQAPYTEAVALYLEAIERCEATHLAYHKTAARPWLWRARAFGKQGEIMLARNDAKRGMDLDKTNLDLGVLANKSFA